MKPIPSFNANDIDFRSNLATDTHTHTHSLTHARTHTHTLTHARAQQSSAGLALSAAEKGGSCPAELVGGQKSKWRWRRGEPLPGGAGCSWAEAS